MTDRETGNPTGAQRNPIRRLYNWVLSWADSPYGPLAMILVSFGDSSFFPAPPDPLLWALVLGARQKAWRLAAMCTAASVLGAVVGYGIGASIWSALEPVFIPRLFKCHHFINVGNQFADDAGLAIFAAAFTPIPFKVFTISAGVYSDVVDLGTLVGASVLGRGLRFFGFTALFYFFGPQIRGFIEKRLEVATMALGVLAMAFVGYKMFLSGKHTAECPDGRVLAKDRCACVAETTPPSPATPPTGATIGAPPKAPSPAPAAP